MTTQDKLNQIYNNLKKNWTPQCEHLMGAIFATNADPYIIEDEDVAYDVAESINNSKGHTVLTPADGEEWETAMAQLDLTQANKATEIHVYDIPGGLKVCYPEHWQYPDNI